jgi:hypothetical protein
MSILSGIGSFFCTDAIAVSTFVSQFYLQYRGVEKAIVVPLDRITQLLDHQPIDLAVNIHSFSECRTQAIEWWARLLSKYRIKNLMVVPNGTGSRGERLLTNDGHDFLPILEHYGYGTVAVEPTFRTVSVIVGILIFAARVNRELSLRRAASTAPDERRGINANDLLIG